MFVAAAFGDGVIEEGFVIGAVGEVGVAVEEKLAV